ncbi:WxL domain-containing protein [Latilactobacillus sakei]|uniref:WxL domain-containing protein n=2 Tax=Latilactobacillus sakei TaxID=1599 RepID=UPI000976DCE9|nr:WxL domain-containing protein [Latilactobacillus sakei]MDH0600421.1 WxL domain-containing protein [Latilactobacillus sakei]
MHMDLDTLHTRTPTYSLGGTTGLYTYTDKTPSDKQLFRLTYWKDGYPDDPEYEMVNSQDDSKYYGKQWGQYTGGGVSILAPGWEINGTDKNITDPGKYQLYKGHGYNHPVWHFKWAYQEVQPRERYQVNMDFGLSSEVDYNNVEATKSYENLTSKDGYNRVGDRLKFKLLGRNTEWDTNLTNIMIIDAIPKDFMVDTATFKLVDSTGKEQVLSPSVYDPQTGLLKVDVPGSMGFNKTVYITFEVNIAPSASGKTVTNSMDIYTDKASKHDSSDVQVKVEKAQVLLHKQVKNLTTPDESYATETKGKLGDTLSYQIHAVNVSTEREVKPGADIEDVLDSALTSDREVMIDYFDVNGTTIQQETGQFDNNGHLKLAYAIPKAGHATLTFTANITDNSQEVINNSARVTYDDGESTQSNNTVVNLPKPIIPIMQKDVRNVTNNDAEFVKETTGAIGDEVEYRIMAVNASTEERIPKETMFSDQLDEDLVNDTPVTVEYYSVLGTKTATQEVYFQNGKFKLNYEIEPSGYIMVYFKAKISKTTKSVVNNTATLAEGKSNVAKVNIIKKTPPMLIKDVKNLTKADEDYALETEAEVDDQVEYRIQLVNMTSIDTKIGAVLKDVLDPDLGDIQQVKIDYLDKDEKITATQTADLTDDQVTLDHVLPAGGQGMAIAYIKAKVKETDKTVINNQASLTTEFGKGTSDRAKLNIKQSKGRIVVRYRDRKDESHKLAEDETFDGKIGDTRLVQPKVIPETDGNWTVVDSSNMVDPDWGSTTKPDWTLAHDYTVTYAKDEQVITYRYEESHIGIIADKRWDFGQHDTTATDRNYYLKAKTQDGKKQPYEVGVEDYYTSKGWTLNVKQDDQFHTNANEKIGGSQKFLDNAVLNFHNGQIALKESDDIGSTAPVSKLTSEFELVPEGAPVNLMTHTNKTPDPGYYAAHGFGIWAYQFGDAKQADYSIGLKVPKATKRFPRQYTSQLTWSLVIAE